MPLFSASHATYATATIDINNTPRHIDDELIRRRHCAAPAATMPALTPPQIRRQREDISPDTPLFCFRHYAHLLMIAFFIVDIATYADLADNTQISRH
jgi:hypothetical protein